MGLASVRELPLRRRIKGKPEIDASLLWVEMRHLQSSELGNLGWVQPSHLSGAKVEVPAGSSVESRASLGCSWVVFWGLRSCWHGGNLPAKSRWSHGGKDI